MVICYASMVSRCSDIRVVLQKWPRLQMVDDVGANDRIPLGAMNAGL